MSLHKKQVVVINDSLCHLFIFFTFLHTTPFLLVTLFGQNLWEGDVFKELGKMLAHHCLVNARNGASVVNKMLEDPWYRKVYGQSP